MTELPSRIASDTFKQGLLSLEQGEIRLSPTGQPSVFDMIKVLGAQKSPHKVWSRLAESHPEVRTKCQNLKFPGPGQRETPVARTKEDAYYILGLLPGAVGKKYRADAAKLFVAFLDDPAKLAGELAKRLNQDESEWLEARLNAKRTRHNFTDQLKDFGVVREGYGRCTNAIYQPILGSDAKGLKEQAARRSNLPVKRINPRDHMSIKELNDVELAERVAVGQLKLHDASGNTQAVRIVKKSSEFTRQLLDGAVAIPGI